MHSFPAFQVTVARFGVWQAAVAAVVLTASAALGAWACTFGLSKGAMAGCAAVAFGMAAVGWSLCRRRPTSLRWDGQRWHLGPARTRGEEPASGDVRVAIDLGAWMLLQWHPAVGSPGWLPVQRRGLEAQWHALRCAVYSPRPAPGSAAAAPDL